jgi:hypothetical protein
MESPMHLSNLRGAGADESRIKYPSYKSFDQFIDIDRLKSLDQYLTKQIHKHSSTGANDWFLNEHRLDPTMPHQPGAREVWLTRTKPGTPYNYLDLDQSELWERTEWASQFSELMDFIETLPFRQTGRMLIIYDYEGSEVPAHRDHLEKNVCHDFIWFRTNLKKPFYMYNHQTGEKLYVECYSAWFDTVNQFHGSDAAPGLSFSIRVDGVFSPDFRKKIPIPSGNIAATPALWAAAEIS